MKVIFSGGSTGGALGSYCEQKKKKPQEEENPAGLAKQPQPPPPPLPSLRSGSANDSWIVRSVTVAIKQKNLWTELPDKTSIDYRIFDYFLQYLSPVFVIKIPWTCAKLSRAPSWSCPPYDSYLIFGSIYSCIYLFNRLFIYLYLFIYYLPISSDH